MWCPYEAAAAEGEFKSHSLTVLSADPDANRFLAAEFQESDRIAPTCCSEETWGILDFFFPVFLGMGVPRVRTGRTPSTISRFQSSMTGSYEPSAIYEPDRMNTSAN